MGDLISTYFSKKGNEETPSHSEYDLGVRSGVEIFAVHNGRMEDQRFLVVNDEKKPIYFLAGVPRNDTSLLFMIDTHCREKGMSGKVSPSHLMSSQCAAQVIEKSYDEYGRFFYQIKLRRGEESCIAGNYVINGILEERNWSLVKAVEWICQLCDRLMTERSTGTKKTVLSVSVEDALAFIAKDMTWEELLKNGKPRVITE
ncbi:MAG: hypothetical protein ACD_17C00033G0001 [uncultured bacterium]|nr:MAG: hypothetical protein ACD_17C00033G0001 [uncultured bacterium]